MRLLTSRLKYGDTYFTHFYLCPYLPLTAGTDALSISLLKFKQRIRPDLDAWIDCSVQLLGNLRFSPDTIIIRALRHDETTVRSDFPSALDLLGHSLALHLHCRYVPDLLTKSRTTLPNKYLTRRERRSQLQNVYQFASNHPLQNSSASSDVPSSTFPADPPAPQIHSTPFLLIDDILTTGNTMRALIATIRLNHPASPIKAFTLTRAGCSKQTHSLTTGDQIVTPETLQSTIFAKTV